MKEPKIKVIGIGNGGINAVNLMIEHKLNGLEFVAMDVDSQDVEKSNAQTRIQLKEKVEDSISNIRVTLKDSDMVIVVCGMGGKTAANVTPIVTCLAKEMGILTVAVVTKPFNFEGKARTETAINGLKKLKNSTDSLIVTDNNKLVETAMKYNSFTETFNLVDKVQLQAVQSITDIVSVAGLIVVDFDDIKSVLSSSGCGLLGIGIASGENAALNAVKLAIDSNYSDCQLTGSKGVIVNVTGGSGMTLNDVNIVGSEILDIVADNAEIVYGSIVDDRLNDDDIQVTIIATGFNDI